MYLINLLLLIFHHTRLKLRKIHVVRRLKNWYDQSQSPYEKPMKTSPKQPKPPTRIGGVVNPPIYAWLDRPRMSMDHPDQRRPAPFFEPNH